MLLFIETRLSALPETCFWISHRPVPSVTAPDTPHRDHADATGVSVARAPALASEDLRLG